VIAQEIDGSANRRRSIASHEEAGARPLDPLQQSRSSLFQFLYVAQQPGKS
jgi:hypothetical protein